MALAPLLLVGGASGGANGIQKSTTRSRLRQRPIAILIMARHSHVSTYCTISSC
jgi:hypothetical protein